MIKPEDVRFHTPDDVAYDWAETSFFSVYLPEPNIAAWVYLVARPGVGAFVCDVEAINCVERNPLDALYVDFRQHLPMPERFDSFSLPNGLTLETSNQPRDYRLRYTGLDGTELDWHVEGLMEPYDIADPAMDPMASDDVDPEKTGFGAAYANHFDMTVRVRGTTTIRGRSFDTDCVTVMDHSWGPRNESLMRPMGWINACFGEDYAVHTIWSRDMGSAGDAAQRSSTVNGGWDAFGFAHGYALVDGKVRGLKAGHLRSTPGREGLPAGYEMRVVDVDDREHVLAGTAVTQHQWPCYSNSLVPLSTVRWYAEGRVGHGMSMENWPLDQLTGRDFASGGH